MTEPPSSTVASSSSSRRTLAMADTIILAILASMVHAVIDCHFLGIYTLILRSLLSVISQDDSVALG